MTIVYHTHVSTKIPLDEFEDEDFVTREYVDSHAGNGAAGRFEFAQSVADDEWVIYHGLGQRIVSVQVVDDVGTVVLCDVDFETVNRCVLNFVKPKTGIAVIRR